MRLFTNLIRYLFIPKQVWVVNCSQAKNDSAIDARVFLDYATAQRWRELMEDEGYFCQTLKVDVLWNERGD